MSVPGLEPSASVLDAFRLSVAESVARILDISLDLAYSGADLGKKGVDFTVAVPRFRLKSKPQDLVKQIETEVRPPCRTLDMDSLLTT